jgi:hypothetical protein
MKGIAEADALPKYRLRSEAVDSNTVKPVFPNFDAASLQQVI